MKKTLSNLLPQSTKNKFHKISSSLSASKYGKPSEKIKVIGVTGTKGKTTVCSMIAVMLDSAGIKNAMETTINTKIGDETTPHKTKDKWVTTPPPSHLQKFLKDAVDAKCEYAVLEVTSQGIDQHRVANIKFDTLVYTNLSQEHLEYHKTMKEYFNAKKKVFVDNPKAKFIINQDDKEWQKIYELPALQKLTYSTKKIVVNGVVARKIIPTADSISFTAAHQKGQTTINLNMPGVFNVSNALATFSVGLALGLNTEKIKAGLESIIGITGRMESIKVSPKQNFTVIVDYAHNADSLKNVYETITDSIKKSGGRMIAVLGATGKRDNTKRPIMGALVGGFADLAIFTNEDPYDEDPNAIMEEVAAGIFKGAKKKGQWRLHRNYWKVLDRAQAIKKAIKEAKKNDVVIITGKGAEEVMAVGIDEFVPFSDRKIVRSELEKRFK